MQSRSSLGMYQLNAFTNKAMISGTDGSIHIITGLSSESVHV